jgi:peptide deformylase
MEIVRYPDPVLRRKAIPIEPDHDGLDALVVTMLEVMKEANGVGLAAPQVGQSLRLFVASESGDPAEAMVCVNPRIEAFGTMVELEEGCLSLPGIQAKVQRPERVRLKAQDLSGEEFACEAEGLLARILQHEYDHIDGILFFERMTATDQMRIRDDLKSLEDQAR